MARRAHVGTAPIYRRWPGKEALIEDAVFSADTAWLPAETADLHADMAEWVRHFVRRIAEPSTRAALPGLISAYHADPERYRDLYERADLPAHAALCARVRGALPAGSATAELVVEILIARTLVRGLMHGYDEIDTFCTRTADALVALIEAAA